MFFIYYYFPNDVQQIHAANELYERKWRLNSDNNIWFCKKESNSDKITSDTNDELSEYMYFHPQDWKQYHYCYHITNPLNFVSENEIMSYLNDKN